MKRALWLGTALSLIASAACATQVILTAGTTWNVPADWNSQQNTVEIIGAGAAGNIQCGGSTVTIGGGGGAYVKKTNVVMAASSTVAVHFGGESGTNGFVGVADGVWIVSSSTVYAQSGWDGGNCGTAGSGGLASGSIGDVKFSGGSGSTALGSGDGTAAGGGAAGPHGVGGDGVGGSGGGNGTGGTGDAGFGGAGGVGVGVGGNGIEFDGSHGAGGGGGSTAAGGGNQGGRYGGGAGYNPSTQPGLIVITYTPRKRVSASVF